MYAQVSTHIQTDKQKTHTHTHTDRLPCEHSKQPVDNIPHDLQWWLTNK